ncbi:Cellular tumor antigen p53, partial [Stegodyphus mimosarum]
MFSLPEHAFEIVKRCQIHAHEDKLKGNPAYEHVLQCMEKEAVYEKNSVTGQCSVIVPYKELDGRDDINTYMFKLTCFSSCSSGLNRRPFMIQFTLENNNVILGRQTLHVRVCASPLRDSRVETRKNVKVCSLHGGSSNENPEELVSDNPRQSTSSY